LRTEKKKRSTTTHHITKETNMRVQIAITTLVVSTLISCTGVAAGAAELAADAADGQVDPFAFMYGAAPKHGSYDPKTSERNRIARELETLIDVEYDSYGSYDDDTSTEEPTDSPTTIDGSYGSYGEEEEEEEDAGSYYITEEEEEESSPSPSPSPSPTPDQEYDGQIKIEGELELELDLTEQECIEDSATLIAIALSQRTAIANRCNLLVRFVKTALIGCVQQTSGGRRHLEQQAVKHEYVIEIDGKEVPSTQFESANEVQAVLDTFVDGGSGQAQFVTELKTQFDANSITTTESEIANSIQQSTQVVGDVQKRAGTDNSSDDNLPGFAIALVTIGCVGTVVAVLAVVHFSINKRLEMGSGKNDIPPGAVPVDLESGKRMSKKQSANSVFTGTNAAHEL